MHDRAGIEGFDFIDRGEPLVEALPVRFHEIVSVAGKRNFWGRDKEVKNGFERVGDTVAETTSR